MRRARLSDWQRRLQSRQKDWRIRISRFAFESIPSLGTAEVPIVSPLTVFCGPNGTGKTTLLRALWATLDPAGASTVMAERRVNRAGSASADIVWSDTPSTLEVDFSVDLLQPRHVSVTPVVYVDSASETRKHQDFFSRFESVDEITNGAGMNVLDQKSLSEINYILQRDYRSVNLYEIEADGVIPFFEVAYANDRYDSRTMGSGEISAFYIWWMLKNMDKDSVVLIEEPEAFLSFACQQSIAEHIIVQIVDKHLCAIISSHSPPLISIMPKESLRFFFRGRTGVEIIANNPPPNYYEKIGIISHFEAIVFVEDALAADFCKGLLERIDASFARRVFIEVCGGDGEIVKAIQVTKNLRGPLSFIGLFDGDMRGKIPENALANSTCLPGQAAIEAVFREMVAGETAPLAELAGNTQLPVILATLEGADHHDWYEQISKELGLTRSQLFPMLFQIWYRSEENRLAADTMFAEITQIIDR